ncbi:Alpha/Beta hydrolase protein [Podospora didyma]|uniref:Alpha/Beta hydrolase protein n=1 Tax=Podospora didyma TaxID=330526 RepID=A0AAE0K5N6_9PEZI|nr:Alpha/Beta hydrolase protein [Podospora didyma]
MSPRNTTQFTHFPDPLIIEPLQQPHKQTFILLHGRGSSATKFGPALLQTSFPFPSVLPPANTTTPVTTLISTFPHARFIFPTAPRSRATLYRRSIIRQWFDNSDLTTPDDQHTSAANEGTMVEGLQRTVGYLHDLLKQEIAVLSGGGGGGAENVVLGGLSQGCATSLVTLLLWDGETRLGGAFGMCGWVPFLPHLWSGGHGSGAVGAVDGKGELYGERVSDDDEEEGDDEDGEDEDEDGEQEYDSDGDESNGDEDEEENDEEDGDDEDERLDRKTAEGKGESWEDTFDPFSHSDSGDDSEKETHPASSLPAHPAVAAVHILREKLELKGKQLESPSPSLRTPLFLGHGDKDGKVPIHLGRGAANCLESLGVDVSWREYEGLGHWYSREMLADLTHFLKSRTGWKEDQAKKP